MKKLLVIMALLAMSVAVPSTAKAFNLVEILIVIANCEVVMTAESPTGEKSVTIEVTDPKQQEQFGEKLEVKFPDKLYSDLADARLMVGDKQTDLIIALDPKSGTIRAAGYGVGTNMQPGPLDPLCP